MSAVQGIAIAIVIVINLAAFVTGWLALRKAMAVEEWTAWAVRNRQVRRADQSSPLPPATGSHQPTIRATCPCGDWFSIEVGASWDKARTEGRDER